MRVPGRWVGRSRISGGEHIREGALGRCARAVHAANLGARRLGVSRRVIVDLAATGGRGLPEPASGRAPRVAPPALGAGAGRQTMPVPALVSAPVRIRPSVPDVSLFPPTPGCDRGAALTARRTGPRLRRIPAGRRHCARAGGLTGTGSRGRRRPEQVVVTSGYTQGLGVVCHARRRPGRTRNALEDPRHPSGRADREPGRTGARGDRGRAAAPGSTSCRRRRRRGRC